MKESSFEEIEIKNLFHPMESALKRIGYAKGSITESYMRDIGGPVISSITSSLMDVQPSDPLEYLIGLLTAQKDKREAGSVRDEIDILHFNDVYNIEGQDREPKGGAARFVTKVDSWRSNSSASLVLFSGDAFNPSLMSTVTKGRQMVPVLNRIGVDVACMGNHDFDFGIENLENLVRQCHFPWLISNVKYKPTGRNLAEGETFVIKQCGGRRIGFIGIVEYEWMATLSTVEEGDVEYEDFCECTRRLSGLLREIHHVDAVVAITHMRVPNDEKLARECGDVVDLIAGGHDHHYDCKKIEPHGCYVLKSGTDFRDATTMKMKWVDGEVVVEELERIVVDGEVKEDKEVKETVQTFLKVLGAEMEKDVGYTNVPLDGRFQMIRTSETNLGNFITDIMRRGTSTDVAILNSGTLRSDCIMPTGDLKMKDLVAILPMVDETIVIEMDGPQLILALENGVSQYPRLEGRFPQVSGISFTFDANLPAGSRVIPGSVTVGDEPLEGEGGRKYKVVTKAYLAKGKDGYGVFKDCKILVDEEEAPVLPALVRNTFTELSVLNGFKNKSRHNSVMKSALTWRRKTFHATPTKEAAKDGEEEEGKGVGGEQGTPKEGGVAIPKTPGTPGMPGTSFTPGKAAAMSYGINPVLEGRIKCLNPAEVM